MTKALFIGLTTVDIQYFVDEYPEPNTKLKTDAPLVYAGGPAANAAITYTYLGGEADFLTCIGNNSFSNLLFSDIEQNKLNVIDVFENKSFQPIVATVITTLSNSDRTILTHHPLPINNVPSVELNLEQYNFIFIDGFYPEIAVTICEKARSIGKTVIFDGGSWKSQISDLLPLVNIAICSNNYFPPGCSSLAERIGFTKAQGVEHVAISRGGESIIVENDEIPVSVVDTLDSLGAGDILHGAFCWFYSNNPDFLKALEKASIVATYSTTLKGTRNWMNGNLDKIMC